MKTISSFKFILLFIIIPSCLLCQDDWTFKLRSKVELSKWQLNSKAYRQPTSLEGALVELVGTSGPIAATKTDKDGNFDMSIPSGGNYTVTITADGYNTKMFSLNVGTTPVKGNGINNVPWLSMTGFIGSKAIKGVGDLGLSSPVVKAESKKISFNGLDLPVYMNDADYRVIQKFCTCNKLGDIALQEKNYALAKTYYEMAMMIKEGEEYPKEQLKKASEGLKMQDLEERAARNKNRPKAKTAASTIQVRSTNNSAPVKNTVSSTPKSGSGGGRRALPTLGGKK
jgi:hypothetical protein